MTRQMMSANRSGIGDPHSYVCEKFRITFDGIYIDPGRFPLPGESQKKTGLDPFGKSPCASTESEKKQEKKRMQSTIGTFEPYTAKDGAKMFQLKIRLPFAVRADFIVKKNENKNKDTAPDAKIFYHGLEVGAIWTKSAKSDPNMIYKSGQLLCPFLPNGELSFAIFRNKEDEKSPVQKVVADFGSRNGSAPATTDPDFN